MNVAFDLHFQFGPGFEGFGNSRKFFMRGYV